MRAMRLHGYGGPEMIRADEIDRPVPGPGEVLVRVRATTFNPSEAGLRQGLLRTMLPLDLPYTMGLEVAGTAESGGPVIARLDGGAAADYVVAPADLLVPVPAGVPLADAAVLPIAGLTAWQAVFEQAGVTAGDRVLINGVGAIGRFAVQLARHAGAHVTAIATSRDIKGTALTGIDRFDAVLHLVPAAPGHAALIRPGGVLVSVTTPADQLPRGDFRAVHFIVRNDRDQLARMLALVAAGTLRIDIAARRPLTDLPEVHREAEAGRLPGKVLLLP